MKVRFENYQGPDLETHDVEMPEVPRIGEHVSLPSSRIMVREVLWTPFDWEVKVIVRVW